MKDLLALAELREASMRRAFTRYDANHNGCIESNELALLLLDLGFDEAVCEAEFAKADKDGDRSISFGEFCEFYNSLIDKISNVTRGVRNVASMRRKSHHTRRRRRSSDQSLGSVGIPVATPRAAPRTEASTPPVVSRVEVKESGAVTTVPAHVEKAQPPPRPELIRFDSISDEIAAYERGEIAAPSAEVVEDTRVACKTCGRKFVPKSIARHERICAKAAANAKRRGKFRVTRVRR